MGLVDRAKECAEDDNVDFFNVGSDTGGTDAEKAGENTRVEICLFAPCPAEISFLRGAKAKEENAAVSIMITTMDIEPCLSDFYSCRKNNKKILASNRELSDRLVQQATVK